MDQSEVLTNIPEYPARNIIVRAYQFPRPRKRVRKSSVTAYEREHSLTNLKTTERKGEKVVLELLLRKTAERKWGVGELLHMPKVSASTSGVSSSRCSDGEVNLPRKRWTADARRLGWHHSLSQWQAASCPHRFSGGAHAGNAERLRLNHGPLLLKGLG